VLAQPTDHAARCQVAAGSYLTGTVVSGPRFKPGAPLHGSRSGADLHDTTAPSDPLDRPGDGQGHWHFLRFRAAHLAGAPTAAAPAAHLQALARSELATKLTNIVGLYIDPPAHAVMLSIDEKSQIQALDPRCSNRSAGSAKRALSSSVAKAPLDQIAQFYAIDLARSSEHGCLVSGGTESSQTRPWREMDSNRRSPLGTTVTRIGLKKVQQLCAQGLRRRVRTREMLRRSRYPDARLL
jgi:hypothetical protein